MQEAQTFSRFGVPDTTACTRWMFGFQRRLVFFFDQGTLWPNPGLLPHMSHTAATGVRSQEITSKQMRCPKLGNRKRVPDKVQRRPIARSLGLGCGGVPARLGVQEVRPPCHIVMACQPG
jgi:hypothetical protein